MPGRNVKLDLLRILAILACIVGHALMAEAPGEDTYKWCTLFLPDTAAIFFMASGGIILCRDKPADWRYVWHRIGTFLPEFIIFSALYVGLDVWLGWFPEGHSPAQSLLYMLVSPTWAPGWFVLALIGVYAVLPLVWAWVHQATRRQIETGMAIWLCATCLPVIEPHTIVVVPQSIFGTLFNYAGYLVIGYYLVRWPFQSRSLRFRICFFAVTAAIGIVFGYFVGRSGFKWGYINGLLTGLSINIVMVSLLLTAIVLQMPDRWFGGAFGRILSRLSMLSLGVYCCHWLVIRYWAMENGTDWLLSSIVAIAVSIPVAWLMYLCRRFIKTGLQTALRRK